MVGKWFGVGFLLVLGGAGCGQSRGDEAEPIDFTDAEVTFVVNGFRTPEVPIGVWCVLRKGAHAKLVPIEQGVSEIPLQFGSLHMVAGEPWLRWGNAQLAFMGRLQGCAPREALPLDHPGGDWSRVASWYAYADPAEALFLGSPGGGSWMIESERVIDLGWHPSTNALWYARRLPGEEDSTPAPSDLFYVEVTEGTVSTPRLIDTNARSPRWSITGEWLIYERYEAPRLAAWNRDSGEIVTLDAYPERGFAGYDESPTGGDLRVWYNEDTFNDLPAVRIRFNLTSGAVSEFETADLVTTSWLAPYPWLHGARRDGTGSDVYDWSDPNEIKQYSLSEGLVVGSPRPGEAIVAGPEGSETGARVVSGLPSETNLIRDLPGGSFGEFSPDGRYVIVIASAFDGLGQPTGNPHVEILDVEPNGGSFTAITPRPLFLRNENILWPTPDSAAFLFYDRDAERVHVRVTERDAGGGEWNVVDASSRSDTWSQDARVFVVGEP